MFYLVMAILTALSIAAGFAVYTKDENPRPEVYAAMVVCAVLGALLWPLALVVLAIGGVFWITRDAMKKPKPTIIPEAEAETGDAE